MIKNETNLYKQQIVMLTNSLNTLQYETTNF